MDGYGNKNARVMQQTQAHMAAAAAQQMHWDQNQNYMMMKKEFEKSFRRATTQLDL